MASEEDDFRPWRRLRPRTPTEIFVELSGVLGFAVLVGCILLTPGPAAIPAVLPSAAFIGIAVLARLPYLWTLPDAATTPEEITAQYENARSTCAWLQAGIVWGVGVGMCCRPGFSLSFAPPAARNVLASTSLVAAFVSVVALASLMIRAYRPSALLHTPKQREVRSLFQSVVLHIYLALLLLGGGGAVPKKEASISQKAAPIEVVLLDSPEVEPKLTEPRVSPLTDQVRPTKGNNLHQAAHGVLEHNRATEHPKEDTKLTPTLSNSSQDFSEPLLLLDEKRTQQFFGASPPFVSASAKSVDTPKGMLQGQICFIPEGTQSLDATEGCKPSGTLFVPNLYVPRTDFLKGFPGISGRYEWFAIDYRGTFTVRTAGSYRFRLYSDDGARLYIDGERLTNNDGLHPASNAFATVYLAAKEHSIRVHYFQGPKMEVALILSVSPPGSLERVWTTEL